MTIFATGLFQSRFKKRNAWTMAGRHNRRQRLAGIEVGDRDFVHFHFAAPAVGGGEYGRRQ